MSIELEKLWKYSDCDEGRYCNDICLEVSNDAIVQVMKAYGTVDVYLHLSVTLVRIWVCGQLYAPVTLPPVKELPLGCWGKPRKT